MSWVGRLTHSVTFSSHYQNLGACHSRIAMKPHPHFAYHPRPPSPPFVPRPESLSVRIYLRMPEMKLWGKLIPYLSCHHVCEKLMPGFGSLMRLGDDDAVDDRPLCGNGRHFSSCTTAGQILPHTLLQTSLYISRYRAVSRHRSVFISPTSENCNNITFCYDYDICIRVCRTSTNTTYSHTTASPDAKAHLIFFHFVDLGPYPWMLSLYHKHNIKRHATLRSFRITHKTRSHDIVRQQAHTWAWHGIY